MSFSSQGGERPEWRQLLNLGERLMDEATIKAQTGLIADSLADLLNCRAQVWLEQMILPNIAGAPWAEAGDIPAAPPTPAMRDAYREHRICIRNGRSQIVAVPIVSRETVLGAIQARRPLKQPFTETEIDLLDGIAAQSGIAIQSSRQRMIDQWRIEQLSLVRTVSAQIANVLDLDELARRVTSLILKTFNYYYVAIFTLEPGQQTLKFRDSAGPLREGVAAPIEGFSPQLTANLGQGIIGVAAQSGEEIMACEVSQDDRYRHTDLLPETRSEAAFPLKIEGRINGVLDVQSNQPYAFHEIDMLVLRALADNIATAVESARLYGDLRRRAEQLSSVAEVSNAITSILDLDELLEIVISLITNRLGYPNAQIFTVQPGIHKVVYATGSSPRNQELRDSGFAFGIDDLDGIIPWVTRNGDTVLANDVSVEPRYRAVDLFGLETRAEMTVPLIFGGDVVGVLDVQSNHENAFTDDDRFLFEALADNIAVAIHNAHLYRSEQWRRQVADSMREVAGLLSADVDLDQVLDIILTELERTLPCDVAAIWLLEETGDDDPDDALPPLRLAACRSHPPLDCPFDDLSPTAWLAEALEAGKPIVRSSGSTAYDPVGAVLGFPEDYSAIAAPMRTGSQPVGVLTLAHRTAGRYGPESRAMTETFASYAAVAIENTRLYEAAHEQAWVSTVLLQVAEATQSLSDINELLADVVEVTPTLVGINSCALLIHDEHLDAFLPVAAKGLTPEQLDEFKGWYIHRGESPAFDQLLALKKPILLYVFMEDAILAQQMTAALGEANLSQAKSLVLFPLVARGDVLGALLVDYSDESGEGILQDEKLAIIQGIAHQTAIAIENIRLLRAQKEEAYVSVALLQVAQAVVSLTDLDEILDSIVRITPILVGVQRTAIFLWDEVHGAFRLASSYGIPSPVEEALTGRIFTPDGFPLLRAVHDSGRSTFYPLGEPRESPEDWEHLAPLIAASPDDSAETIASLEKEILSFDTCLLMGFPLSVKGIVLGVMLIEEAGDESGKSPHHMRERRLEIITGISQQAALAIQNDQLQRDLVVRERLEREMQLAREIQRAFLPHELPALEGWELDARWQPAREVGGDFYDVFVLPGNRIGLVIADVADKGMPAALFMTLVRTLIRAAIHELDSPAAVMEQVNELLIPDSQNGMFVTAVYAVLSTETGEFVYANAGHNPPLWLSRSEQKIERLMPGGMALGVLDGIHIQEKSVKLQPGDCLLLYTDGVTDAFSPQEELYGEMRLQETMLSADCTTAKETLDVIEASITDFIAGLPLFDDLTMLVVQRKEE